MILNTLRCSTAAASPRRRKDSPFQKPAHLKGKRVVHAAPSSNSSQMAPMALFPAEGLAPDKDYKVLFSGKHDQSVMGVNSGELKIIAAIVDRAVIERILSHLGLDLCPPPRVPARAGDRERAQLTGAEVGQRRGQRVEHRMDVAGKDARIHALRIRHVDELQARRAQQLLDRARRWRPRSSRTRRPDSRPRPERRARIRAASRPAAPPDRAHRRERSRSGCAPTRDRRRPLRRQSRPWPLQTRSCPAQDRLPAAIARCCRRHRNRARRPRAWRAHGPHRRHRS